VTWLKFGALMFDHGSLVISTASGWRISIIQSKRARKKSPVAIGCNPKTLRKCNQLRWIARDPAM
jgi:hypothetical protein